MKANSKPSSSTRRRLFDLEGASSAPSWNFSFAPAEPCCSPNPTASDCPSLRPVFVECRTAIIGENVFRPRDYVGSDRPVDASANIEADEGLRGLAV